MCKILKKMNVWIYEICAYFRANSNNLSLFSWFNEGFTLCNASSKSSILIGLKSEAVIFETWERATERSGINAAVLHSASKSEYE